MSKEISKCDPYDIVGKVYNGREVIEYIGVQRYFKVKEGKYQKIHMYMVKCTTCGKEVRLSRSALKISGCQVCSAHERCKGRVQPEEQVRRRVDVRSKNPTANRNNTSGIKYLHTYFSKSRGYNVYSARVNVKGKTRRCYSGMDRENAEYWCHRMQEVICERGVDGFVDWFDSGEWEKEESKRRYENLLG